jgi:hypothetical protein
VAGIDDPVRLTALSDGQKTTWTPRF